MTRPTLCEACAAGRDRAYCPMFPVPCEDQIEIWDEAREDTLSMCVEYLQVAGYQDAAFVLKAIAAEAKCQVCHLDARACILFNAAHHTFEPEEPSHE